MDNLKISFRFNSRDNGIRLTTMSSDIPKEKKRIVDHKILKYPPRPITRQISSS